MFSTLFKWIKEGFGIYVFLCITNFMLLYTLLPFDGIIGFFITVAIFAPFAGIIAAMMPQFISIYVLVYRPAIAIAIKVPLIIIKILIFVLIQIPLHYLGASTNFIWGALETSVGNITTDSDDEDSSKRPKYRYVAVFIFFLALSVHSFGLNFDTLTALISDAALVSLPIVLFPVIMTLLISSLAFRWNNDGFVDPDLIKEPDEGQTNNTNANQGSSRIARAGRKAKGAYDKTPDAVKAGAAVGAYKGLKYQAGNGAKQMAKGGLESGGISIVRSLRTIPLIGSRLAGPLEGAIVSNGGVMGAGGVALGSLATALFWILVALIVLMIFWIIIAIFIWISFGIVFYFVFMPFVAETFGPAIGLGADYASYGGSQVDGIIPEYDFTGEKNALRMAGARIGCALEGPACLREWQMNNSERPGSESVGVKFGLEIEEFNVNQGNTIDIAGWDKSESIPITLQVYNTVQGLRGINAENARYRVNIYDGDTVVCSSTEDEEDLDEWSYLGGEFVGDNDENEGRILPGDFSNPSGRLESLSIGNCGLLQPALGEQNIDEAEVEIRYDYSSQSTLSFDAMSEDYRSDAQIRKDVKPSETADTPVQTYVNVRNPVTFQERSGQRNSEVFPVNIGFETERFNTEYKINVDDFELHPSSVVEDVDQAGIDTSLNCDDLDYDSDRDVYELSQSKKDDIEDTQENSWYSRGFAPEATCYMVLKEDEIGSISPTGETLNMHVDGNYTVKTMSDHADFETRNTRCNNPDFECPLIVVDSTDQDEKYKDMGIGQEDYPILRSSCDSSWSIDASRNGCTVVENKEDWGNPTAINDQSDDNLFRNNIDNKKTAYLLSNVIENVPNNYHVIARYSSLTDDTSQTAIGLRDSPRDIESSGNAWVIEAQDNAKGYSTRIFERQRAYCDGADDEAILEDLGVNPDTLVAAGVQKRDPHWLANNFAYTSCPTSNSLLTDVWNGIT